MDKRAVNLVVFLITLIIAFSILNAVVTGWGILDGISLADFLADEFKITVLPAPPSGSACMSNDDSLIPLCTGKYRGYSVRIPDSQIFINSAGFRGREYVLEKDPSLIRIFMLGDSFTFGLGVDNDGTFAARLEEKLNENDETGPVEVFNLGVPGANTEQEYSRLMRYLNFSPDMVVLETMSDDVLECNPPDAETLGAVGHERDEEWYLAARSYYLSLGEDARCACVREHLQRIADVTSGEGIPLLIYEFDTQPGFPCFTDVEGGGIYHLKAQTYSRNYRLSRVDGHLNAAGNERAAEELFPAVLSIIARTRPEVLD